MSVPSAAAPPPTVRERLRGRSYVALAKPEITALICAVAVGGYVLADPRSIDLLRLLLLVAAGAAASAGAAMLNHYLDRDLDALMKRTRHRPLPEARIAPTSSAAFLGLLLLGAGVGFASVLLNPLTGFSIFL
ncbi:MAG: UbiA family prenyltransferase, partial [Thermoplasmata archaeon]